MTKAMEISSRFLVLSFIRLIAASAIPPQDVVLAPRQISPADVGAFSLPGFGESSTGGSFNLDWQLQDRPLFSAEWSGGIGDIPIGPLLEGAGDDLFSFVLECVDCRTTGTITAQFTENDIIDASASLTFNNVAAYFDLGLATSSDGTFSIGIGRSLGNSNVTGKVLSAGFDFGIDLVLEFSGAVQASGGFMLSIPDGEQVGFDINVNLDGGVNATADLSIIPQVNFGLLPISLNNSAANITAALRLRAQVGVAASLGDVKGSFEVGAFINLVEVTLGIADPAPASCAGKTAIFVDAESNAGAFVDAEVDIPGEAFSKAPGASTVFFEAGTTTCIDSTTARPSFQQTVAASLAAASNATACPTALATSSTTITTTYSLTSCVVRAVNCPISLTQVVVVTNVEAATTTFCPVAIPTSSSTASITSAKPSGSASTSGKRTSRTTSSRPATTTTSTSTTTTSSTQSNTVSVASITNPLALQSLQNPIVATLNIGNATSPVNATVTGTFVAIATAGDEPGVFESDAGMGVVSHCLRAARSGAVLAGLVVLGAVVI